MAALARAWEQLVAARVAVAAYLLAWLVAAFLARYLWRAAGERTQAQSADSGADTSAREWSIAVPLLAVAALAYWNGAILDPLQFRGFPDYVTQMLGARRLMAGALPYDPALPVWKDVNLPPATLLLLFAPLLVPPEQAGRLAFFWLNHAAFLAGLVVLLRWARPAAAGLRWYALVVALALAFEPWHDSQRLGQQNGIVFCLLSLSAVWLAHRREALSGGALALALIAKPSSALLGVYLLFTGRWRAAAAAAATGIAIVLVTLPWTGIENWRFYLVEKVPQIAAGTAQQSNVALLALHARLFLPREALSSFDPLPDLPAAQAMTRVAQALGLFALWRLVRLRPGETRRSRRVLLEFGLALTLSLALIGHAWQSYVTWLIIAFLPLASPAAWAALRPRVRWPLAGLAAGCYTTLALDDVALYNVVGQTSATAAVLASLPNVALLVYAFVLACLLRADHGGSMA